jgi:IclR family acetate operon transcriptional repressor
VKRRQAFLHTHPLPHFTQHSITDPEQFLAVVEEAARTGIAMDHEEYLMGVNAIAVPLTGTGSSLVALLCALGFAAQFDDAAMQRAAQQLRTEAEAISRLLGNR